MKTAKMMLAASVSLALWGCNQDSPTTSTTETQQEGTAQISISAAKVGQLARAAGPQADINLSKLILTLTAPGETPIADTIALSGNGSSNVSRQFTGLTPLKTWTVSAKSLDSKDSVIHQGGTSFEVRPAQTANVNLDLNAKYSMLKAQFTPVRDSVTSLHLLLDGLEINSTSFASGTQASGKVLDYDYMTAGNPATNHMVKLQAKGVYWGIPYTLYEGEISIDVLSGRDTSYVVTLAWVGPGEPPKGQADMTVNLGNIGTVNVVGNMANDPHSLNAVGFTGAFAPANWTLSGVAQRTMDANQIFFNVPSGGGGVTAEITIPADGTISFNYNMNVSVPGDYGCNSRYNVNGTSTVLTSFGSGSGTVTSVNVKAGDVFQLATWGGTKYSSYFGTFSNFTFTSK